MKKSLTKSATKRKFESKDTAESSAKKVRAKLEEPNAVSEEESMDEVESEDELDNSSNGGSETSEDELEDSEVDGGEESDEESDAEGGKGEEEQSSSKSSRVQHLEQKKLKDERKLNKPNGEKIQQIKRVWERLRVKSGTPPEVRAKLLNQAWDLSKDCVKDLVLKHDASRVVQTILKYADKEKRFAITKALKGTYVELAKSSYGKYLLVKLLHYGSKETRQDIIDELYGNFRKLMRHKEGAYVIEDAYRDYSSAAQKRQIVREFYGSEFALFKDEGHNDKSLSEIIKENPDKRRFLMKNLNDVIVSAVNKGSIGFTIIHAAMLEYVKNIDVNTSEKDDFIDLVAEQFPEIVHTVEGSQVASIVLSIATAKERKALVRSLKTFGYKLAEDEQGQFVLTTLFNTVDDTVMVFKAFHSEFTGENMTKLILSKSGRRPFLYLLTGRSSRYFTPQLLDRLKQVDELKKNTSKKDDGVRRMELNKAFSPYFFDSIIADTETLLKDSFGAQFILETLLYGFGDEEKRTQAAEAVVQQLAKCSPSDKSHVIHMPFTGRLLRALIQQGHWNSKEGKVDLAPEPRLDFMSLLAPTIIDHAIEWSTDAGSFVVVALLENLDNASKSRLEKVLKDGMKEVKTAAKSNKGSQLIVDKL